MPGTNRVGFRYGPLGLAVILALPVPGCGEAEKPPVVDVEGPVGERPSRTTSAGRIEKVRVETPGR